MSHQIHVIDVEAVQRTEIACRNVLLHQPDDLEMRIRIAQCLLMRALFQAGIESLENSPTIPRSSARFASMGLLANAARSSRSLLNECLRHTSIVERLCHDSELQSQITTMHRMFGILGCADQLLIAEAQVSIVLDRIARDIAG